MSLFKKKEIIAKNSGKTEIKLRNNSEKDSHDKSSRKDTPGFRQTDPEQQNNHRPTRRRGKLDQMHRPTRRTGELDRESHPTHPFGESDQLACLRPVLVAPSFGIGSNMLLFRLDRSHHWN
ncbi:hypothetical protein F2Q69_00061376 [Brassica cretica]|uniref:Uncharacterized protein n=1 Tax=Brassica cretica TaxID=69181 RepID=A0A8S9RJM4_BRACR|nr:hypothetical protein F2Q69_00061376 [Brassica cretica]